MTEENHPEKRADIELMSAKRMSCFPRMTDAVGELLSFVSVDETGLFRYCPRLRPQTGRRKLQCCPAVGRPE